MKTVELPYFINRQKIETQRDVEEIITLPTILGTCLVGTMLWYCFTQVLIAWTRGY